MKGRDTPELKPYFQLAFEKRPEFELDDLRKDPWQTRNVAGEPSYRSTRNKLHEQVRQWMQRTGDPRSQNPHDDRFDRFEYFGGKPKKTG